MTENWRVKSDKYLLHLQFFPPLPLTETKIWQRRPLTVEELKSCITARTGQHVTFKTPAVLHCSPQFPNFFLSVVKRGGDGNTVVNMPPSQLFWYMLQAANSKGAYFQIAIAFLRFNIFFLFSTSNNKNIFVIALDPQCLFIYGR